MSVSTASERTTAFTNAVRSAQIVPPVIIISCRGKRDEIVAQYPHRLLAARAGQSLSPRALHPIERHRPDDVTGVFKAMQERTEMYLGEGLNTDRRMHSRCLRL